ncbi:hypothetical protein PENSPDRAFT_567886 [Peniophora sp. CONT]|nr:hypothetical protein PENSPDRAFT_567886 [Peniophora sp. CONT]
MASSLYGPKPGCTFCGIVQQGQRRDSALDEPFSPSNSNSQYEILHKDTDFTCWREKNNPVSSKAHVILAFNLHVPSLYTLSSSDLPLLSRLRELATRLLTSFQPSSSPMLSPNPNQPTHTVRPPSFCIGFIAPPFYDSKIPVKDHLHAHAYILPADKLGWLRALAYSGLAWYDIDDLIAEIRESVSNNRIRSGGSGKHASQPRAIDRVPDAGARAGNADGLETTDPSLAGDLPADDVESGLIRPSTDSTLTAGSSRTSTPRSPSVVISPPGSPFGKAGPSRQNSGYSRAANGSTPNLTASGDIPHIQV